MDRPNSIIIIKKASNKIFDNIWFKSVFSFFEQVTVFNGQQPL